MLVPPILEANPGFLEGRKVLRAAQIAKTKGASSLEKSMSGVKIAPMVLSAKSKEALAKAKAHAAEAAKAIEQKKTIEAATSLIQTRSEQIFQTLHGLWEELRQTLPQLETIVGRETDWRRLRPEEQQAVAVITSLAYLLKQLIDAPLFDAEGNPVDDTLKLINAAKLRLEGSNA